MKTLSSTLAFVGLSFVSALAMATPKYPLVLEVHGKVLWTNKNDEEGRLKSKQVLIEKAGLQTEGDGQILVQIDAHRQLRLLPNSHLQIPSISWETGDAPVVVLRSGSFRWKEEAGKKYNIALRSDLFEFLSPVGDFVFSYDPKKAIAESKVVQGSMEFSAMNAEDSALITAGQKVSFQGVREGDEIVYDVLLKGKKIPRGKLGLVEGFSAEEKKLYSEAQAKKEATLQHQKELAEQKAKERPRDPTEICAQPYGKLNQCVWVCENNPKQERKICRLENPEVRCLRKRCNANGEWAEETLISKAKVSSISREKAPSPCGVKPIVKDCDY